MCLKASPGEIYIIIKASGFHLRKFWSSSIALQPPALLEYFFLRLPWLFIYLSASVTLIKHK